MDRRHTCPTTCRTAHGVHEYAYNIHTSPVENRNALTPACPLTHGCYIRPTNRAAQRFDTETCWKHLSRNANHGSSSNHHYRLSIPCP